MVAQWLRSDNQFAVQVPMPMLSGIWQGTCMKDKKHTWKIAPVSVVVEIGLCGKPDTPKCNSLQDGIQSVNLNILTQQEGNIFRKL